MEIRTLQDLAAAVRGRRSLLKLTQVALSQKAGVSRTFVQDLEAGKLTVELRSVLSVLDALGLTINLHGGKTAPTETRSEADERKGDLDLDEILDDYDQGYP